MARNTTTTINVEYTRGRNWIHSAYRGGSYASKHFHSVEVPGSMSLEPQSEITYDHRHEGGDRPHSHDVGRLLDALIDTTKIDQ